MNVEELLKQYASGVINFSGADLSEANLSGIKLSGANFRQANLSIVNLSGANLSEADFSHAKLNIARLSGANLTGAILNNASLNVANLIRADISRAQLRNASLVRAELIRAELSRADLSEANLNTADLREATLRHTNLRQANLNGATLKGACLVGANLEMANLNSADLSRCDLSNTNLRDAELKQTNFQNANLSGADLTGANLRWADLNGANLSWADLTGAKLSGANLVGANLTNANLTNASLVHANLIQATLIKAEWVGADLTSAILTGAKLYSTSRFGLKTEGLVCQWIDLSPGGDRSIVQRFDTEDPREFFNESAPTIQIIVDATLEAEAHFALAGAYYQISQEYRSLKQSPNIEVSRRTILTFRLDSDLTLFSTACMAILPFQDASNTQNNLRAVLAMLEQQNISQLGIKTAQRVEQFMSAIEQTINQAQKIKQTKKNLHLARKINFFQAPTQTILTNSSTQTLMVYQNPNFGKQFMNLVSNDTNSSGKSSSDYIISTLPTLNSLLDFLNSFHYINE